MSHQYVNKSNEIQIIQQIDAELFARKKETDEKLSALSNETGYKIIQEYGQRKTGPPPFWTGPPPSPKDCEIFLGKIPRNIIEDELFPICQKAGVIYEFRLIMDFSLTNKGYAFVTYTTKSEAQRAIAVLNGYEIRPGRRLGVKKSRDNGKLLIADIPMDKSKEEIHAEMSKHTSVVIGVTIYINDSLEKGTTRNLGFAVVEYESHRAATLARKILANVKLFDREFIFDWAGPDEKPNVKAVSALLIRNLPFDIDEKYLNCIASLQGTVAVQSISKVKNFALVDYISKGDAELVLSKVDGLNVGGCSFKATLVKPSKYCPSTLQNIVRKQKPYQEWNSRPWNSNAVIQSSKQNALPGKFMFGSSPSRILSEICQMNGWGDPVFHIVLISSSPDDIDATYTSRVYIPNLPHPVKLFANSGIFFSASEAKNFAADFALKNIASMQLVSGPKIPNTFSPTPQLNNLYPEISYAAPKKSIFDIWDDAGLPNYLPNGISPSKNEFTDQNDFFNVLSSAASLANMQIQSKMIPDQSLHFHAG